MTSAVQEDIFTVPKEKRRWLEGQIAYESIELLSPIILDPLVNFFGVPAVSIAKACPPDVSMCLSVFSSGYKH
ncbi:Hypothetical predicted protein [Podarcis lilfordi]|uniref:Uncharacterized protein n=1 Tax=Podarcis lilfordi TaxID=74358 RepID=A0AA35KE60_9SAUR|nr:Hypothetical predicted protein [Podarcis lilfordi]